MNIIEARKELLKGKTIYDMPLKVASYGRVSTDKLDQVNSLENQINYFKDLIKGVSNWTYVNCYADEGISGTQVKKREQFLKMIEDAKEGKIDLILTKEISRFSRNTVDSIEYTNLLLKYGVIVFFLSDNINTIYPDSEFRLTLMASMAQDEVRKLSERVKFGIKRSIKDGKVMGGYLTGYTKKDGKLIINEDEAPIVRKLFSLYATGKYGFKMISKILKEEGYYTKKGKEFSDITLKKMLQNKKYKGYYTANMSYVDDYKTHKKKNIPESEWIVYKDKQNNIPVLIDEDLWNKANEIYQMRKKLWNKNNLNKSNYIINNSFTSKLICSTHQESFIKVANGKRKNNPVWVCNKYLREGLKGCESPIIYEKHLNYILKAIISKCFNKSELIAKIVSDYENIIKKEENEKKRQNIENKLGEINILNERLLNLILKGIISESDFKKKQDKLNNEKNKLEKELKEIDEVFYDNLIRKIKINIINKLRDDNLINYMDIFIKKIMVEKICKNRKNIRLKIIYNYQEKNDIVEFKINGKNLIESISYL